MIAPRIALVLVLFVAGCATPPAETGRRLIESGDGEAGVRHLAEALAQKPSDASLKSAYHTQRERVTAGWLTEAQQAIEGGRFDVAETRLAQTLRLHPENPRARDLAAQLETARRHRNQIDEAARLLAANQPDAAESIARRVLGETPSHAGAQAVLRQTAALREAAQQHPGELDAAYARRISLEFRDAPVRSVFDLVSRQSGINFVFDRDVRTDTRVTLFARDVPVREAIDMLLLTGQLARRVVNANTLLIYPDTPQKQKAYQELRMRAFYLGNADARNTVNLLRTLVKTRDLHVDERLNLLVMRDTPEAIRLAEKLIAAQDLAEPEVMLEVEILEIKRGRLLDLGIQYPNQFSLLNTLTTNTATTTGGVIVNTTTTTLSPLPLTLENLRNVQRSDVAINSPQVNIKKEDSDVNLLANPRIRVKNREKAKIHIGDKVPVITSNTTATGVVSESVAFLDVGLKLDVEPAVLMRDDVQIKVALEVSNIVREIRSPSGTLTYQIGTRNAGTTLRLKDGETQVLAGLISDEDRTSANRIPGLGDLPLLGRLFSSQRDERNKTEIVLLITPRVLRQIHSDPPALTEFAAGTENTVGGGGFAPRAASLPGGLPAPIAPQPVSAEAATESPPDDAPVPVPGIPGGLPFPGRLDAEPAPN